MLGKEEVVDHATNPDKGIDNNGVVHIGCYMNLTVSTTQVKERKGDEYVRLGFGPAVGNMDRTTPKSR
jgi:hypothetical protein